MKKLCGPLGLALVSCWFAACGGGDSTALSLAINEVMPSNMASTCTDEGGGNADWIELYNMGTSEVDLEGLAVTDNPQIPLKKQLGPGLKIAPGGVLLLWADDKPEQGPAHLPFKLAAEAEQVLIHDKNGKLLDQFAWTAAATDVSYARLPDGTGTFQVCPIPTCGKPNGSSCGL